VNLGALKTAVKRYGFDDNDPLVTWINAALHEIFLNQSLVEVLLENESAFQTNSGVSNLNASLPADFFKVIRLVDETVSTDVTPLEYVPYRKFRNEYPSPNTSGNPEIFTVRALNQIVVYPVPNRTTSWRLVYQGQETELAADGDVPNPLPLKSHYGIVYKAAAIGLMAENEEERAQTAEAQFDRIMDPIMNLYADRQAGEFGTVGDAQDYGDE